MHVRLRGSYPQGCPSAVPLRSRSQASSITTLPQAKRVCKPSETVCGTPEDDYGIGFQCVDTNVTSDHCKLSHIAGDISHTFTGGGCYIPHTFHTSEEPRPSGKDCHQIPHAIKAGCSAGDCVVYACEAGWLPSPEGDSCVEQSTRKLLRKRNRSSSLTSTATDVSSGVISDVALVIKAFVDINAGVGSSVGVISDPSAGGVLDLLHSTDRATIALLMAPNALALSDSLTALIELTNTIVANVVACNCRTILGLASPETSLEAIAVILDNLNAMLEVQGTVLSLPLIANQALQMSIAPLIDPLSIEGLELNTFASVSLPASLGNANLIAGLGAGLTDEPVAPSDDVLLALDASIDDLATLVFSLNSTAALYPTLTTVTLATEAPLIDSSLLCALVDAAIAIARDPTNVALVSENLGTILTLGRVAIQSLTDCQCVLDLGLSAFFDQLVQILDVASTIQGSWASLASDSSAATDVPIVAGLTTVSNELGLPLAGAIVVDGLLGDALDSTINDVLNGLHVGPLDTK